MYWLRWGHDTCRHPVCDKRSMYVTNVLVTGDCAPLQVTITDRSGSTSCVGDLVNYTCTLPAVSHNWRIPSLGDVSITRINPIFPRPGDPPSQFSIVTTSDEGGTNPITTVLSVTSFAGLNGITITCSDGNRFINETQEAIAMVFGKCSLYTGGEGGSTVTHYFTKEVIHATLKTASLMCPFSHTHS